jgi:flagellar assembly protein FliH
MMTWSSEFPFAAEPMHVAAPDSWLLADLSYITEIVAVQAAEPRNDVAVAQAAAEGHARGFADGRLVGEGAERVRLRTAFDAANEALCGVSANVRSWEAAFEDNVTALAAAIARHLLDQELQADPAVIARLVARARQELAVGEPVRVRVNPTDLAALVSATDGETDPTEQWIADPTITPGGCVVEGRERIVDGRVETTLERLYRRLAVHDD